MQIIAKEKNGMKKFNKIIITLLLINSIITSIPVFSKEIPITTYLIGGKHSITTYEVTKDSKNLNTSKIV